ncbi:MFS transporter [Bailinhaonella thermotolerans]|uniref:MFS transporter n=1 Tax=Bailinhaonella thermotolerans TaxID=1070861 RepID=A0A3A4AW19_9ACTN|nr:MFS transporter [Bailinhaonella thermotolerans]RJL32527.1 MFS transporter [Bailinhaonella thermotolerans]
MTATEDRPAPPRLSADPDFRRLFGAAALSQFGGQLGHLALPLLAVTGLNATPGQVGLLAALGAAAFLLIGLPAGVWVDRLPRRPVMIAADLARVVLVASVPAAWWAGVLTMAQLHAVALLSGTATLFFDLASQSYVPHLVGRARLLAANSALVSLQAVTDISGRSAAGLLVQVLTAPVAILADALTYLWSAARLRAIRAPEPPRPARRTRLWPGVREAARFVGGDAALRAIALQGALTSAGVQLCLVMLPVLFVRGLRLPETVLGLFLAAGGVGALLGARCAPALSRRLGHGRSALYPAVASAPLALLIPLVGAGPGLWAAALGWTAVAFRVGANNVALVSLRQRVTPDEMLGRMNGVFRFVFTGAVALGAALGGLLGEVSGPRAALWAGALCLAVSWAPIAFSPLRRARDLS